ncbi:hypothetical protein pb186bvf_017831 [Paramecium bursaria]
MNPRSLTKTPKKKVARTLSQNYMADTSIQYNETKKIDQLEYQIQQLMEERIEHQEILMKIKENEEQIHTQFQNLQLENEQLKSQIKEQNQQIRTIEYQTQTKLSFESQQINQQLRDKLQKLKKDYDSLNKENNELKDLIKSQTIQLDSYKQQIQELEKSRSIEINQLILSREKSIRNISQITLKEQDQLLQAYNKLELLNSDLQREIQKLKNDRLLLSNQLEKQNVQYQDVCLELENLKTIEIQLKSEVRQLNTKVNQTQNLQILLDQKTHDLEFSNKQIERQNQYLRHFEKSHNEQQQQISILQNQLQQSPINQIALQAARLSPKKIVIKTIN